MAAGVTGKESGRHLVVDGGWAAGKRIRQGLRGVSAVRLDELGISARYMIAAFRMSKSLTSPIPEEPER